MINKLLAKVIGTQNDRELKRMMPVVAQVNALEEKMRALSDEELKESAPKFRERLAKGESVTALATEYGVSRQTVYNYKIA